MRSQTDVLVQAVRGPVYNHFLNLPSSSTAICNKLSLVYGEPIAPCVAIYFPHAPPLPPFSSLFNNRKKIKEQTVPFLGCAKRSLIKAANSAVFFLLRPASLNFSVKNSARGTHSAYKSLFFLQPIHTKVELLTPAQRSFFLHIAWAGFPH